MAYNKKYAELGESVIDYVNDREDAIEGAFESFIESGSNDNGRWIKFPGGTMICTRNVVPDRTTTNRQYFDMPQEFISIPYTNASHWAGENTQYNESNQSLAVSGSTKNWSIKFMKTTVVGADFGMQLIAIGFWK